MSSAGNAELYRSIQDGDTSLQSWLNAVDEGTVSLKHIHSGPYAQDTRKGHAFYQFIKNYGNDKKPYTVKIEGEFQPIQKAAGAHAKRYIQAAPADPAQPHPVQLQQAQSPPIQPQQVELAQLQPGAQAEINGSIAQVAQMQAASAQVQGSAQAEANGKRKALELDDQMDLDMAVHGPSHQKDAGVVPSTPASKSNRKVRQRQNHPDDEPTSGPSNSPLHTQDQHQSGSSNSPSSQHDRQRSTPARRSSRVSRSSSSTSVASTSNAGQQQGFNNTASGSFSSSSGAPDASPHQDQVMNDVAGPSTSTSASASTSNSNPTGIRDPNTAPSRAVGGNARRAPPVSEGAAAFLPPSLHLHTYRHQQQQEQQRLASFTSGPRAVDFRTFAPSVPGSVWGGMQDGRSNYASSVADSVGSDGTVTQSVYNANQARAGQISNEVLDLLINNPNHMDI